MAKYTENIRLAQPEGSDYYDIEVFNHNSELIDKKIGEMDNSLSTIKEGATRAKAGIVQLGTEEGKALEGMMLARLAGCVGYGGDIQEEGVKDINYIYYDRNTRKMYKCLNQNSDVSANAANFIPLDNNSLLDRLENLNTFVNFSCYDGVITTEATNMKFVEYIKQLVENKNVPRIFYLIPSHFRDLKFFPNQNTRIELVILYAGGLGLKAYCFEPASAKFYFIDTWNLENENVIKYKIL